jgi:hypothetical protein
MSDKSYGLTAKLSVPYDEAVDKVTTALKSEGFGILTEIDVKATLKQKLNADFRKYVILGACNPLWLTGRSWRSWTSGCCCPATLLSTKRAMAQWCRPLIL